MAGSKHYRRNGSCGCPQPTAVRGGRWRPRYPSRRQLHATRVWTHAGDRRSEASSKIYAPGPIVDAEILHPKHPIFYGYHNNNIPVRYANGLFLDIPQRHRNNWVLMRFTGTVRSGHMRGNSQTETRPAIVDVPQEDGRIVLFATNPCYRWQNHGEFTMLFNTLLHFNDLGVVQASEQTNAARVQP